MLENYKGEKKTEEMETTLNTEVPVQIPAGHTTEAKLVFQQCDPNNEHGNLITCTHISQIIT